MQLKQLIAHLWGAKGKKMSLQDQITADQQSVIDAQTALDAANAKLVANQAKLAAWTAIEQAAQALTHEDVKAQVLALVEQGKGQ